MIATGGGRFDPGRRPIFFAATSFTIPELPEHVLVATNDQMTSTDRIDQNIEAGRSILLDSGIFWLTNNHKRAHPGLTMDEALALPPAALDGFEDLWSRYIYLAKRYEADLWGYIELDQGGAVHKRATRDRLHAEGLNPIPVYHPLNDGWAYFDELASTYDRMCLGNLVQAAAPTRLRLLRTIWERHRDYPDLWIHGLGLMANQVMHAYPLDSCDASSWVGPLRWQHQKVITADLQMFSEHYYDARYKLGDSDNMHKGERLVCWCPFELHVSWQAHYLELERLGLPAFPPRLEQEPAPCPG